MNEKKLKTFEEKVNRFLKLRESSGYYLEAEYVKKFDYMSIEEIKDVIGFCSKIEEEARQLAGQVNESIFTKDHFKEFFKSKYPYLEETRIDRLISRSLYWVLA